jgi:hypothetical protein
VPLGAQGAAPGPGGFGRPPEGPEDRSLPERCILWPTAGPPMMPSFYNNNYQIVQAPGYVMILVEMIHDARIIPLDSRPHLDAKVRQWMGDSRGHWEGNTLVVETINVRDDTQLDFTGIPHSDALHITERWRRKDAKTLENTITLTDPKAYAEPFTATRTYQLKPKWKISEYVCEENNRNARDEQGHTSGGALQQK